VAASHIRVGTFEYAARRHESTLRALADSAIERHYPELVGAPRNYLEFYREVADRQASLIARWQHVGFIHGVMNTDNMAISGETIDYGPCAFMNAYHPDTVFSSIDRGGRYAFDNQPGIGLWNLARFGEALLTLLDPDPETAVGVANEVLEDFPARFERYWLAGMRKKLGLQRDQAGDAELIRALLDWMQKARADYTNTFRDLSSDMPPAAERYQDGEFQTWYSRWRERLAREEQPGAAELMRSVNPAVIPRNHRVEEALSAAEGRDELSVLHRLLEVLASPYEERPETAPYREPPTDECGYRTFCGT